MELNKYQVKASTTIVYDKHIKKLVNRELKYKREELFKLLYVVLGLGGEVGELQNKIKKIVRGDYTLMSIKDQLMAEIGDILWYIAALCSELHINLNDVAEHNLEKLKLRAIINKL